MNRKYTRIPTEAVIPVSSHQPHIGFYRIICGFLLLSSLPLSVLFQSAAVDAYAPMPYALVMTALAGLVFILSYISPIARAHMQALMFALFFSVSIWVAILLHANNGHFYYALASLLVVLIYPAFIYSMQMVTIYSVLSSSLFISVYVQLENPLFDKLLYLCLLPIVAALVCLGSYMRLQLQKLLSERELFLSTVFNSATDALLITTPAGDEIIACNSRALEMFGLRHQHDLLRQSLPTLLPDIKASMQHVGRLNTSHTHLSGQSTFITADGQSRWADYAARPLSDASKRLLVRISDITQNKRAEGAVRRLQEEMLHLSRQAGMAEVAISVMHNIGNNLNGLQIAVERSKEIMRKSKIRTLAQVGLLLQSKSDDLPSFLSNDPRGRRVPELLLALTKHIADEYRALRERADQMRDDIDRIAHVVRQQKEYTFHPELRASVEVADIIEDAVRMRGEELKLAGIDLRIDAPDDIEVMVDRHLISQIMVALLDNARDAIDELDVAVASELPDTNDLSSSSNQHLYDNVSPRLRKIYISTDSSHSGWLRIEVRDTGIGIKPDNITRIFAQGYSTKGGEHGLGLHTSANIAQAMGGRLLAYSEGPGHGATFTLDLPVPVNTSASMRLATLDSQKLLAAVGLDSALDSVSGLGSGLDSPSGSDLS